MDKTLTCDCGFEARADDDDRLAAEVQRHAWRAHGMALSHEDALVLAFRAELDDAASTTNLGETTTPTEREQP